jgi:hypothetical protein
MLAIVIAASFAAASNVRSTDPVIAAALAEGLQQSDVIRRLVATIDASNVIVYLARGDCPTPAVACLMLPSSGPDVRHVRINFELPIGLGKLGGWFGDELSVALAHELQHAAEIAGWPEVVDTRTLQAAYSRPGVDRGASHLDTDAAVQAGNARRAELLRARRR